MAAGRGPNREKSGRIGSVAEAVRRAAGGAEQRTDAGPESMSIGRSMPGGSRSAEDREAV